MQEPLKNKLYKIMRHRDNEAPDSTNSLKEQFTHSISMLNYWLYGLKNKGKKQVEQEATVSLSITDGINISTWFRGGQPDYTV